MQIGIDEIPILLVVVPNSYIQNPVLLGMDALGRVQLVIDRSRQKVLINNVKFQLRYEEHSIGQVKRVQEEQGSKNTTKEKIALAKIK
ncbi:hypothetical protein E2C01_090535 [Portunus trituberculatus]|uniref:Uncharacterized protein n=1 Tax=Portunus trituberculatus TaxID=210409 RepID=A0A5B7JQL4_PORTR|nr:hypothetical protein [Portunus trituberculatus]